MIKTNTFIKVAATTLTACILSACGGGSSDSNKNTNTNTNTNNTIENSADNTNYSLNLESNPSEVVGKTTYSIKIKDNNDLPVYGVTPTLKPMMAMTGGHKHSSPHTGCTETDDEGSADCTVYFLMPSQMNNVVMGEWDLEFSLPDTDTVINHTPIVSMPMGTTVLAKLKGDANDQIPKMDMTEARTYLIFNNGITGMGDNRSVELFIAAKESMMSFPALTAALTLNEGDVDNELTISTTNDVVVKISTDSSADISTWVQATSKGEGIWAVTGIAGLTDKLYISLSVNSEIKTTVDENGDPAQYATFDVVDM